MKTIELICYAISAIFVGLGFLLVINWWKNRRKKRQAKKIVEAFGFFLKVYEMGQNERNKRTATPLKKSPNQNF